MMLMVMCLVVDLRGAGVVFVVFIFLFFSLLTGLYKYSSDLQFNFSESALGYHKFFEPLKFQLCWSNLVFYRHGSATRVSKQPKKKVDSLSYANRNKHTVIINIQGVVEPCRYSIAIASMSVS